ncbi:hypothetical protein C8R44DRAFT_887518 [Mycena epipterygia]|nr:hypothetical protein C8R44DRAFT_887518 [Mycena epipterygia]
MAQLSLSPACSRLSCVQLIEGLITTVVAMCIFFLMIYSPWISPSKELPYSSPPSSRRFPTWTTIEKQLLSIPVRRTPHLLLQALAISCFRYFMAPAVQVVVPYVSMRVDARGPFMAVLANIGVDTPFSSAPSPHARYAACFLVTGAAFPFGAFSPGLVAVNTGPDATRAVALSVFFSVGNVGGIIASPSRASTWTYVSSDAPNYHKGNTLDLAGIVVVLVLTVATIVYMEWENAQRARLPP